MSNQLLDRDDLEKLYREKFEPMTPDMERMWSETSSRFKKIQKVSFLFVVGILILMFFLLGRIENMGGVILTISLIVLFFYGIFFFVLWLKNRSELDELFTPMRNEMIMTCLNMLGDNMSYEREGKERKDFENEMKDLFPKFNKYYSNDRITGRIDGTPFEFFEITIKDIKEEVGRNTRDTDKKTKFWFAGYIIVLNVTGYDKTEIRFVPKGKKIWTTMAIAPFSSKRRVKLESLQFEELFDVYSNDQIMSRKFFNPAFMEYFVTFSKKILIGESSNIRGNLVDGKFILSVGSKKARFELKTKDGKVLFRKFFDDIFEDLEPVIKLVALLEQKKI